MKANVPGLLHRLMHPRHQAGAGVLPRLPGDFVINGTLALESGTEPVNFNAVLQPSSLHYAISRGVRAART